MTMPGLLNIDKTSGETSRWVVDRVKRLVRPAKVGHAGTLDPLAAGVLVVCVGWATRLIPYVQRMAKSYRATFLLGRTSDTEDVEGEVAELPSPPEPTRDQIVTAAAQFVGEVLQRPPAYSAIKVQGRRAYNLARAGEDVQLAPRTVRIERIDVIEYRYPELTLDVHCHSGTYIRSLGRDLAESLGTGAVLSALKRTAIGPFTVDDAVRAEDLTKANVSDFLLPAEEAVRELPCVTLSDEQIGTISQGQSIALTETDFSDAALEEMCRDDEAIDGNATKPTDVEIAGFDRQHRLRAILICKAPGRLSPKRNFPPPA